jgi:pimeloyl-ACP methyl ester carboxylesterase
VPIAELDGLTISYLRRGSGPPLLLMAGIPAKSSDVLAKRIPAARLEVIPAAGHLFFVEQPEATQRLLEAFLDAR